jgi:hypothetical protein
MVDFKSPYCIEHILYSVECFPFKVLNWSKNVTFVLFQRNLLFKGTSNSTRGITLIMLENFFKITDQSNKSGLIS